MSVVRLTLPLPPSPNRQTKAHHMAAHRQKREYQRAAWLDACRQYKPPRDPPAKVRISATFYVKRRRDEDANLDLKWAIDALRQYQADRGDWRCYNGQLLYSECGYFENDDPGHLELAGKPTQQIDRKRPRLELLIESLAPHP